MGATPEKITEYVNANKYFQHNAGIVDGLDGLGKAMEVMAKLGMSMMYEKNHFVLGEGNFVLTASEGQFLGKKVSFYDLFRLEDGQIVEHWNVIEEIPAKDQWKNSNGKFFLGGKGLLSKSFLQFFDRPFKSPIITVDSDMHATNRILIDIISKEYLKSSNSSDENLISSLFQSFYVLYSK